MNTKLVNCKDNFKELRNCVLHIICVWSLYCSTWVDTSLHFYLFFLKNVFLSFWAFCIFCLFCVNPIQNGPFRGCSRMMRGQKGPLPKIFYTYPTMMKLGTVIPYLKKTQKIYESSDTSLELCWHQYFFIGSQKILLYQKVQI